MVVQEPEEELQPLFPIGAYIKDCDLKLGWSRDACVLRSPAGECLRWSSKAAAPLRQLYSQS